MIARVARVGARARGSVSTNRELGPFSGANHAVLAGATQALH
jgi:hypothetical protein